MTATLIASTKSVGLHRNPFSRDTQTYERVSGLARPGTPELLAARTAYEQRVSGHTTAGLVFYGLGATYETRTASALMPETFTEPLTIIQHAVVARFAAILPVAHIFYDRLQAMPIFSVFVEGEYYDDALMDQLLDTELELHQQFAPQRLTFNYLPHLGGEPRNALRDTAQCLFERAHGRPH